MSRSTDIDERTLSEAWRLDDARTEYTCSIFSVEARAMHQSRPPANHAVFHVIRCPDWVNIVALTDDDAIVLIHQWRAGVDRTTLEIPGGMIDPDEAPLAAAIRELREETGYEADDWQLIGVVEPNPAIQDNRCHTFVARGARAVHSPEFDPTEHCVTEVVAFAEVPNLINGGAITHALVIAALHFETLRRTNLRDQP